MSNLFKKAVSKVGSNPKIKKILDSQSSADKANMSGIGGDKIYEPVPNYLETPTEKIVQNEHNSWIVLGRDRVASKMSGYGGKGDTQAASIDIVAGRMGSDVRAASKDGDAIWVNPNFKKDAARIYISQKSDIDKYFDLADGIVGDAVTKSGIALKADGVRIIGREGIKLVTKTDLKNSQGSEIRNITGIDLIAGNDDEDMQPLTKGTNLVDALTALVEHIDNLNGIVDSLLMAQNELNDAVTTHYHTSPYFGAPTLPSETVMSKGMKTMAQHLTKTKTALFQNKVNLELFKNNFLILTGGKYINSRYNHTN
jgi:hypothetical protein